MPQARAIRLGLIETPGWGVLRDEECLEMLRMRGIEIVRPWWRGQWVIGLRSKRVCLVRLLMPWKSYLVYTDDPRLDRNPMNSYPSRWHAPKVHVLNAFAPELFWDNHSFVDMHQIGSATTPDPVDATHFVARKKLLAAAMGFGIEAQVAPPPPVGQNLHGLRVGIMEEAHRRGLGALQGGGWPSSFGASDTGWMAESAGLVDEPWSVVKLRWLGGFWFNLCYENTLAPNYVTEKIWHAVMAGCVPVYYGDGSTIWTDFPPGSFVDGSAFSSPADLLDYLEAMTADEAAERYNRCRESFAAMKQAKSVSYDARRAYRLAAWLQNRT